MDLPDYQNLLTGHYSRSQECHTTRQEGTDDWLVVATLAGTGRFSAPGEVMLSSPRRIVLIPPGVRHDYGTASPEGWGMLWIHFHPRSHWHEWLTWPEQWHGLMLLDLQAAEWEEAQGCLWRVHHWAISSMPHALDLGMAALEELLLRCHSTILQGQSQTDERVLRIIRFIDAHLARSMSIQSLASQVALSPSHLSHLFQKEVGISPMQYVNGQRIERAKQLLERTASSIGQIGEQSGFGPIYFSIRFKQHTGLSPRAYRQRRRTGAANPPARR
jgi:AraC family transcriptional regulator of arabinose operon